MQELAGGPLKAGPSSAHAQAGIPRILKHSGQAQLPWLLLPAFGPGGLLARALQGSGWFCSGLQLPAFGPSGPQPIPRILERSGLCPVARGLGLGGVD